MSDRLLNQVAVVTGGGRGLGRHVAMGLARRGARVALISRSRGQLVETVQQIREAGGVALDVPGDIGNRDDIQRLRERVLDEFGPPSILINAAGVFGPIQLICDSESDRWIDTLMVNTVGPFLTCRAFVNEMIDAGWGRIINFSSAATLHPPGPMNSAYATSKVALNQFTRHLAAELKGTGVTANVIHPGEVKTAMWAAIRTEAAEAGDSAAPFRQWAEAVGAEGGDDPEKSLELVLKLIDGIYAETTGQFLWIEGGSQQPIPSW